MKLAILIVSKDRPELVQQQLEFIRRSVSISHDVYVIEWGTTPDKMSPESSLWYSDSDIRGECFGHNLGLEAARLHEEYDYFWILRSDLVFEGCEDPAAKLAHVLEENPRIAIVAPAAADAGEASETRTVSSCRYPGFMVSGRAIEEVGFLNPDFRWSTGAVEELAYRLYHNEWTIAESNLVSVSCAADSPFENESETPRARRFALEYLRAHFGTNWAQDFWKAAQGHGIQHNTFKECMETWSNVQSDEEIVPWPLATSSKYRLFAWPRYDSPSELDVLLEVFGRPILGRHDACLCLRHDSATDGSQTSAIAALEEAYTRVLGATADLEVLLVDDTMDKSDMPRLGVAVTAIIPLPSSREEPRAETLRIMGSPVIHSAHDLQDLVPGLDLPQDDAPSYSAEELDAVDWELVETIKNLHPWNYPVHVTNLRVAPGQGTGVSAKEIEGQTAARASRLVYEVERHIDFKSKSVLELACDCGFWSARLAERGAARVVGVESNDRLRAQAELYWSSNQFLANDRYRFLDGDLSSASTWDEISASGPHDVTLCAHVPANVDAEEFLRRACEVTRQALIMELPTTNASGEQDSHEEWIAAFKDLGFAPRILTGGSRTNGGARPSHVTLLARRSGVEPSPALPGRQGARQTKPTLDVIAGT